MTATGPDKQQIKAVLDTVSEVYLLQNIKRRSAEAENSLEFLGKQLPEIKGKLNAAEEKLNAYRLESESVDLTMETQSVLQRSVDLEAKINELKIHEGERSLVALPVSIPPTRRCCASAMRWFRKSNNWIIRSRHYRKPSRKSCV